MQNSTQNGAQRNVAAKRVRAILAGGAVLGVGAAITLASWNDSEFAKQTFSAGTFTFQGSVNGTDWADHNTAGTAVELSTPVAGLSPNDVTYLRFALKATGENATVTPVTPAVADGTPAISPALTFAAVTTDGEVCDQAAFAGGTAVGSTLALTDGAPVNLCLQVSAGATLAQGATGTATWQWDAVSN